MRYIKSDIVDCNKCGVKLTEDNSYKYNGHKHKSCRDCRNAYTKAHAKKKAEAKKLGKWF